MNAEEVWKGVPTEIVKMFLGAVAHELRNPLTGVHGRGQLLSTNNKAYLEKKQSQGVIIDPELVTLLESNVRMGEEITKGATESVEVASTSGLLFTPQLYPLVPRVEMALDKNRGKLSEIEVKTELDDDDLVEYPYLGLDMHIDNQINNLLEAMRQQGIENQWVNIRTKKNYGESISLIFENPGKIEEDEEGDCFKLGFTTKQTDKKTKILGYKLPPGFGLAFDKMLLEIYGGKIEKVTEENLVRFIITLPIASIIKNE